MNKQIETIHHIGRLVRSGMRRNRLVTGSIFLVVLITAIAIEAIFFFIYTLSHEEQTIADRHYGDIVVTTELTRDFGPESVWLDDTSGDELFMTGLMEKKPTVFIDTIGFSKPYLFNGSDYYVTYIPYETILRPWLEQQDWYDTSIGRFLRCEYYQDSIAQIILDGYEYDVTLFPSGVDLEEIVNFDYSFTSTGFHRDAYPEHGIFLSTEILIQIQNVTGKYPVVGDRIHIGYGTVGDPSNITEFRVEYLGEIPDTGGRLENGSEQRDAFPAAYLDTESMVRLFGLDQKYSRRAWRNSLPWKEGTLRGFSPETLNLRRPVSQGSHYYDPHQVAIRVKPGYDVEKALEDIRGFLKSGATTTSKSGRHVAMSSLEFLRLGALGKSTSEIVSEQQDDARLLCVSIMSICTLILIGLGYVLALDEYGLQTFLRTIGANRTWMFRYVLLRTGSYILPPGLMGTLAGIWAGAFISRRLVGINVFSIIPVLWSILFFLALVLLLSTITTILSSRRIVQGG